MALDEASLSVLRVTPVLGLFDEAALRVLANVADTRRLKADEVLFRRGDRSDGGFAVLSGSIEVGREAGFSDDGVVVGPGCLVGQTALFLRMQRPATAVALEPTAVMRVSPTLMRRVLQQFPDAADRMSDWIAAELDATAADLDGVRAVLENLDRTVAPTAPARP